MRGMDAAPDAPPALRARGEVALALMQGFRAGPAAANALFGDAMATLEQLERTHIERVLQAADGHRGHAARILGISERNLYRKLRDYGLLT